LRVALTADPGFALARALNAFHLQFEHDRAPAVREIVLAAHHARRATRREQQAVDALRRALVGDTLRARRLIGRHLREFPRDALMIREYVLLRGYGGASGRKRATVAALNRLAPYLGDDPWFLGQHSLALGEIGSLEVAHAKARAALAARADQGVAAHALAHVHFEQRDDTGGRAFLDDWLGDHGRTALNCGHLTWHLTLTQLALSDPDAALARYRQQRTMPHTQTFSIEDEVSLLWRLQLRGLDVTAEWDAVVLDAPPPSSFRPFLLAHHAFALAARHDVDGLHTLRSAVLNAAVEQPQEPLRFLLPLVDALAFVASERWTEAAPALEHAAVVARRLGGSNEQHTLFDETAAFARRRTATRR
jgi:hypothetical protein